MDDEDYARELFAILTRPPDPGLEPGRLGDDFIDRHDGFGTGLRVTSVDVVPGEHGAQLEVGFVLDLAALGLDHLDDVPARGSLRLPLDEEWRRASGLSEPEDYAPRVASTLMRNIHRHVDAHVPARRDPVRLPARDIQRAWLLQVLGRQGVVEEVEPDRYVVHAGDGREDLVARITADEWEQVLQRHGAPREASFDHYEELVASRGRGENVLVCWEGELVTSIREELPPVTDPRPPLREIRRRLAHARASGSDYGWFAYAPGTEPPTDDPRA